MVISPYLISSIVKALTLDMPCSFATSSKRCFRKSLSVMNTTSGVKLLCFGKYGLPVCNAPIFPRSFHAHCSVNFYKNRVLPLLNTASGIIVCFFYRRYIPVDVRFANYQGDRSISMLHYGVKCAQCLYPLVWLHP